MNAKVNDQKCLGCARCMDVCPVGAIAMKNSVAIIDEDECVGCGVYISECPVDTITLVE